ncbi:hypothetical protein ACTQVS_01175 [Anaerovoracaceae bacterium HCP3S3_H6]
MTNKLGFLSKHPTTQKPIPSPFINIGINYMNQAVRLWNEIFQIVKENCSTDYDDAAPQNDLMETTEMQLVAVSKLIPYVNNARTHSAESRYWLYFFLPL